MEMDERLGAAGPRALVGAASCCGPRTVDGHASLGFPDAGRIAVGARADLVTLDLTSPRTAGAGASAETAAFAATAADVVHVVSGGRVVHRRATTADVGATLDRRRPRAVGRPGEQRCSSPGSASWSPTTRAHGGPLGLVADAAVVVEGGRVAWTGPARAGAARPTRRTTSGGAPSSRASSTPTATWSSPATAPPSSPPGWPGERYDGGGIRTTVAATRAADRRAADGEPAAAPRRDAPPGHDDGRGQERLRAHRRATRRGRSRSPRGSPPRPRSSARTSCRRSTPTTRPATSTS